LSFDGKKWKTDNSILANLTNQMLQCFVNPNHNFNGNFECKVCSLLIDLCQHALMAAGRSHMVAALLHLQLLALLATAEEATDALSLLTCGNCGMGLVAC